MVRLATLTLIAALAAAPAMAQAPGILKLVPEERVTEHALIAAGTEVGYRATAGSLDLFGPDGNIRAKMFYTAYTADDGNPDRPLTFVFNGGPGAASAYLHMGFVGPRIIELGPGRDDGATPELTGNPDTWLPFTDLVMVDPVGTGWSRAVNDNATRAFWGVRPDADSLAKFIALYVARNDRLASPKYLMGESYGGFRAVKVAAALREGQGILVSGLVLVSPMLDSDFLGGSDSAPLVAALQLPSLAAARMEREERFDADAVAAAERFAMTDYLVSLAGPPPRGAAAEAFYDRVADLTGVPADLVAQARGFVGGLHQKVAGGAERIVSPYDSGQTAPDTRPEATGTRQDDPVLDGYTRAYGPAFTAYARHELGVDSPMTYTLLNPEANRRWDWDDGRDGAQAAADLSDLLSVVPSLRVAILHGYSDTLTPYGVSRYLLDHLPPELAAGRTELRVYRGGHMFYTDPASRGAASDDMRSFYDRPALD